MSCSADHVSAAERDTAFLELSGLAQQESVDTDGLLELTRTVCAGVQHFRSVGDVTAQQAEALLTLAVALKRGWRANPLSQRHVLAGQTLAMIFEKPSLRTRISFETLMVHLGGHAINLQPQDIQLGKRETVSDVATVLGGMAQGITARVFRHEHVLELAAHAGVPVVNALSDRSHPCQALADFQTIIEHRGTARRQKVVYVGDGNNVAHSLMLLGARLGSHVVIACPEGYEPDEGVRAGAVERAKANGGSIEVTHDPLAAATDADVLYTDVWASMGQEKEAVERAQRFRPYQLNEELAAKAKPDHLVMHCLPAHRGEEISADVMDGPNSVVFDQAETRLHAQKAVLAVLMGRGSHAVE